MSTDDHNNSASLPDQLDITNRYRIEIHAFAESVESLLEALPTVMSLMTSSKRRLTTEMESYLASHAIRMETDEKGQQFYQLEGEPTIEANIRERQISRMTKATTIIHRSFLISIVSQYDAFLGKILRLTYLSHPKLLLDSKQSITIRELLEYSDINDAREELIEREIDNVARKSHEEQLIHCKEKYSVKIVDHLTELARFVELTQRRHLFVHCDGIVSSPYLTKCREARCGIDDKVAVGTQL
ncbi:MAG TPA: hypothetical protein VK147_08910, partial [Candidatus Didemnitutus sp.]|nr:hypothetical protein [Candidatus Didemnitutus sp.]